jgi:hypothetical protein
MSSHTADMCNDIAVIHPSTWERTEGWEGTEKKNA